MTVWKRAPGELDQGRGGVLVPQQRLGRHDHQRLAQAAHHLAAQHVEDLAGRGRLHHLHVGVRRQLHEALQARRAVLRALALVAVRQHQRDAVDAAPLHLARGDELVDHHLGAVDEVAELGFPDHQRIGIVGRVAVFEAEHRLFRQDRVDDHERRLVLGHVFQRRVDADVPLLAVLVVQHGMAVGERAAAAVLARQAHRVAAGHQRSEGHVLAHAPVDVDLAAAHGGAVVQHLAHQRVRREVFGHRGDALGQAFPLRQRDRGVGGVGPFPAEVRRPVDRVLALEVGQHRIGRCACPRPSRPGRP